ncbi:MAG: hypothetical protein FJ280_17135 [Planctomycetes bacterium]|nr:hypothetical protein [Planctomycetota bacterium]
MFATTVCAAIGLAAEPSTRQEPSGVNLALGAAVEARSSMESHPRTAVRHLTDGIMAAGGYQSRPSRLRIPVGLDLGGFTGGWRNAFYKEAKGVTFVRADKVDDAFEYTFEGDEIAWIGTRNSDHGQVEVSIDGKVEATVDTRTGKLELQKELFRRKLAPGKHVFRLRISTPGITEINALEIADSRISASASVKPGEIDEWVTIDLGQEREIHHVRLFPAWVPAREGEGAASFPLDYRVLTRTGQGEFVVAKAVVGQVNPGTAPVTVELGRQRARQVRLEVTRVSGRAAGESDDRLRLAEIEVLGPGPAVARLAPAAVPKPNWRLQTADTAITVAVEDGRPVLHELSAVHTGWNWLAAPTPIALPPRVKVFGVEDHQTVTWSLQEAKETEDAKGRRLTLRFVCGEVPKMTFSCVWWAAVGPGPIQYHEEIDNQVEGNHPTGMLVFNPIRERLDIALRPPRAAALWRFHKDAGGGGRPKSLYLDLLADGSLHEAPFQGGKDQGYGFIPMVALDAGSHGLYLAGEWQDGRFRVEASGPDPVQIRVASLPGSMSPTNTAALFGLTRLAPVYLGAYDGEVDDGANRFKRWFFTHKSPAQVRDDPTEPWTLFTAWWSRKPGWVQYQEVFTKAMRERLSDTGFESVCIDNGWWNKDLWTADPERWPDGMQIAGRLARENGFKLTLYFKRSNSTMAWGKRLSQKMKEYGATTYRSDFGAPSGPAGMAMLDWLIANHPGFRYEHCDEGGKQKDFVMAQRASGIYGIDVYDPLSNRKMFHVSSYCLPPVQLQCPIDDILRAPVYALRSSMQGAMYIGMGFGKGAMPSECPVLIEPMRNNVALFKNRLRPLMRSGDLYHLTLRPDGVNWDGIQYQDPVTGKGAVMLFKPNSKVDTRRIFLKKLARTKTYALSFQDRPEQNLRKTGAELMDDGFDVTMTGELVSEIIWIEESDS